MQMLTYFCFKEEKQKLFFPKIMLAHKYQRSFCFQLVFVVTKQLKLISVLVEEFFFLILPEGCREIVASSSCIVEVEESR
jgi:uncharacterized membrane protein